MDLTQTVLHTVRRHRMLPESGRVIVAVSGGPDSVGLVHLLRELEATAAVVVAGIAHFNHQLRGAESDADETFCRDLASRLGLPIDVGSAPVRDEARQAGRSIEDMARESRYAFLEQAAARYGDAAIAVGHTRDDQAETFLLRLLRGAGTRGLGSIRPVAGRVIRPLLDLPRADVHAYVAARGLGFRKDESNEDVTIARNRVRHELLPYLVTHFSPAVVEVLAREAELAQIDNDRLELEAIDLAVSLVLTNTEPLTDAAADHRIVIDAAALTSVHPALSSRVLRRVMAAVAPGRFIGFDTVQRLLAFAASGASGSHLSLPGCQATHEGDRIRLKPPAPRGVYQETNSFRIPLSIPGEVVLDQQAVAVSASWAEGAGTEIGADRAVSGFVSSVTGPLAVRSRQPGDRFQPAGLGGRSRKLQDYFVDRKVPRESRDLVPLVVDADDRIIWVVGHGFSEAFRASGPSPGVIFLKARRLGGEV